MRRVGVSGAGEVALGRAGPFRGTPSDHLHLRGTWHHRTQPCTRDRRIPTQLDVTKHPSSEYGQRMTRGTTSSTFALTFEDLQLAAEVVELRLAPGSGEADRAARVTRLLDASADLNYAVSTYTYRVSVYTGRRPANEGLRDYTIALQGALDGFAREVRAIADAYRAMLQNPQLDNRSPQLRGSSTEPYDRHFPLTAE